MSRLLAMLHAQVDGEAHEGGVFHDELLQPAALSDARDQSHPTRPSADRSPETRPSDGERSLLEIK